MTEEEKEGKGGKRREKEGKERKEGKIETADGFGFVILASSFSVLIYIDFV